MAPHVVCIMNIKDCRMRGALHSKSSFNMGGILLAQGRSLTLHYQHPSILQLILCVVPNTQSSKPLSPIQVDWLLVTRLPSKYVIISSCVVNPSHCAIWKEQRTCPKRTVFVVLSNDILKDIVKWRDKSYLEKYVNALLKILTLLWSELSPAQSIPFLKHICRSLTSSSFLTLDQYIRQWILVISPQIDGPQKEELTPGTDIEEVLEYGTASTRNGRNFYFLKR